VTPDSSWVALICKYNINENKIMIFVGDGALETYFELSVLRVIDKLVNFAHQ